MRHLFTLSLIIFIQSLAWSQYNVDSLNSVYDEQYPILTPNGRSMYFTRSNHPENIGGEQDKGDIWYSTLVGGKWTKPVHGGSEINNKSWNAVLGFGDNGNQVLLHHHYEDNKQGLSISKKKNKGWTIPESITIPYFLNRSDLQSGSLSQNGDLILLSIESYNSKGGEDLYVIKKNEDNTWTDPKNLGSTVNSLYQEISPYLAEDNKTMFFASNGHKGGRGSFDIYRSIRQDDSWTNWSKPKNIGKEINTQGRESSYIYLLEQETALYVSTLDSDGYGDIKFLKKQEKINSVIEKVVDPIIAAKDLVVSDILVEESKNVDLQADAVFSGSVKSSKDGRYISVELVISSVEKSFRTTVEVINGVFNKPMAAGDYHVRIEANGYISKLLAITLDSVFTSYEIFLSPIVVGELVSLASVLFKQGTSELISSSNEELDAVVDMMQSNASMEISLGGHTDNRGSSKLNFVLSEKRVESVKKYLQSKGIAGKRISGKGYGGSKPIASNKNELTRKLNRRVEFTVTKK
jgi:outer membrane protein OmpA-like peptidoglycan-associated protein